MADISPKLKEKANGISPVIGVVLFVAIVVILAGIVGFFATGLNDNTSEESQAGVTTSEAQGEYQVQVVDSGNTDQVQITVNGQERMSMDASGGGSIDLSEHTQLCEGDKVTIVGVTGETETVLTSDRIDQDVDCQLQGTNTTSTATYDGSSWIVDTFLENTSSERQYYVITLSNGTDQQVTETVTLDPGESKTVTSGDDESLNYDESDPISVGVYSPDQSSSNYTLTGGSTSSGDSTSSTSIGWSGGDQAGSYNYTPTGTDGTSVSSTDSQSGFASSSDSSDGPSLSLSTSRVEAGDTVDAFATLTTTKSPSADETLVLYATETNTSSNIISESTHTIQNGENKRVSSSFSIDSAGQYVISASLKGSGDIHEVGTLNVVESSNVDVKNTSLEDSNGDGQFNVDEQITISSDLQNNASSSKTLTIEFFEDGNEISSREISVSADSTKTISETFTPTEEGLKSFHIGVVEPAVVHKVGEEYITTDSPVSVSVSHSPKEPDTGAEVTFDATASHPDGSVSISEYQWSFADGTTATTSDSTYKRTFQENGKYVEYTVTAVASNGDSQTTGSGISIPYPPEYTPTTFVDDFDDGSYKPNWEPWSRSWSEYDNQIRHTDGYWRLGTITRESQSAYGLWKLNADQWHNGYYYTGYGAADVYVWILANDPDDDQKIESGYYLHLNGGWSGSMEFYKRTDGSDTQIGSYGEIVWRDSSNFEIQRSTDGQFEVRWSNHVWTIEENGEPIEDSELFVLKTAGGGNEGIRWSSISLQKVE